jgi:glycosyltransferase involved in cell wall biosynthesis
MFQSKRVVVVMPAYNAARTLRCTYDEVMQQGIVDLVIVVDDASHDETVKLARTLPNTKVHVHATNRGYGANQKTCYRAALDRGADIIVMLHADYQYTPKLIPAMAHLLGCGEFDVALGSRILGGKALDGGMPLYKYVSNRVLTLVQNLLMGAKLSEYHTGYRAFTRTVLESLPLERNSDDFVFDAQMLSQILYAGFRVGEVTCPAKYFPDASSIGISRSVKYGAGCLAIAAQFRLSKWGIGRFRTFDWAVPGADRTRAPH